MRLRTLLMEIENKDALTTFIKFVVSELGLRTLPTKITVTDSAEFPAQYQTFGTYASGTDTVIVYYGSRHLADVLRTLAHELVHHKQRHDGKVLNGNDGSDIENEANAVAGTLMRKFKEVYPDLYVEN